MPNKDQFERSQEEQINDFLRTFTIHTDSTDADTPTTSQDFWVNSTDEFARLDVSDYAHPYISEETETRIERLKRITQNIEDKVITEHPLHEIPNQGFQVDYWNSLNPSQYLAATTIKGPILVIAGAGSGKTRTITYRVSYMLENGINPEKILLLTFTRKAATEMVKRTSALLKNDGRVDKVMRGTYHAFANYLLRRYANLLGLPTTFTIIDTSDSEDIIDLIRQELKFTKKSKAFPRKSRIQTVISKSRNCAVPIKTILEREFTALLEFEDELNKIADIYHQYKRGNHLFDYDDLMDVLRDSLRDNMAFRRKVQTMYEYIMVDEFQDTNVVQKEIIDLIAERHRNLMVVGDDAQSIYAFRGANFENILTFPETYPKCKVIKLVQNYRSNQDILDFTNSVANNAEMGYPKELFTANRNEWKPMIAKFYDQQEEAEFIVDKILDLREREICLSKVAVLYRASFQGNYVQAELLKRQIPYVVVGGIKFVERRHVKDMISMLRLIVNPLDAVAWNRLLKLIPGIGRVTASKIVASIQQNAGKIDFEALRKRKYGAMLQQLEDTLNQVMSEKITIATKINILTDYYRPLLQSQETDYEKRLLDIDVLHNLACRYEDLQKFLSDFALDPPNSKFQDQNRPLIDESEDKPVTLSTVHSAKGLEWYCVFMPQLLDGLFPSTRSMKAIDYLEEERRLFYVAASRAKEQLYLTMPSYVSSWDTFFTKPSRFIAEVERKKYRVLGKEEL